MKRLVLSLAMIFFTQSLQAADVPAQQEPSAGVSSAQQEPSAGVSSAQEESSASVSSKDLVKLACDLISGRRTAGTKFCEHLARFATVWPNNGRPSRVKQHILVMDSIRELEEEPLTASRRGSATTDHNFAQRQVTTDHNFVQRQVMMQLLQKFRGGAVGGESPTNSN